MTRVSIITPFLNAEAYLAEAIDSVRAQTETDWELLLIDDGSTDGSAAIAADAARADPRIRLLPTPGNAPRGAAAARNAGIAAARGTFVAFLDADDVFEPHMLATTLAAATAHPSAAMIFGPTLWWHPDGSARDQLEPMHGQAGRLHRPPTLLTSLILLQRGHVPCVCSVLVRRAALEVVGGFDERFHLYEDQTLWVKLFRNYDVYVTPVCLSRYRQHAGSASARAVAEGLYARQAEHAARGPFLAWIGDYLRDGPPDPRLARTARLANAVYRRDGGLQDRLDRLEFRATRLAWRLPRRASRLLGRVWRGLGRLSRGRPARFRP